MPQNENADWSDFKLIENNGYNIYHMILWGN